MPWRQPHARGAARQRFHRLPAGRGLRVRLDPANLPRWAAGLARSEVKRDGDEWIAEAPFGKVRIRFAPRNSLGVMDHDVEMESGETIHNAMRVMPNGEGSELVFTLIRRPEMSDQQLAEDRAAIERDLATLKRLLESSHVLHDPSQHDG